MRKLEFFEPLIIGNTNWLSEYQTFMWLDSERDNGTSYIALGMVDELKAVGINDLDRLQAWLNAHQQYAFGFFSYDLKNQLEKVYSKNESIVPSADLQFFVPEILIEIHSNKWSISSDLEKESIDLLKDKIQREHSFSPSQKLDFKQRTSKEEYIKNIHSIQRHIQLGDVYELNYCQSFEASNLNASPYDMYFKLRAEVASPMSTFARFDEKYSLSVSPERFLKKEGNKIISEPIKGTIKRGASAQEDLQLKEELRKSQKDISENIMIVDLVRNDLSRVASKGSVNVDELCEIYSFPNVHQMISRVSCQLSEKHENVDAIRYSFPMGSMTGAPKISAMELIDQYENFKRNLYSGSMGFFKPNGDFDFNVLIRTLFYDTKLKKAVLPAGGAITILSDAEQEYQESVLKVERIREILSS